MSRNPRHILTSFLIYDVNMAEHEKKNNARDGRVIGTTNNAWLLILLKTRVGSFNSLPDDFASDTT